MSLSEKIKGTFDDIKFLRNNDGTFWFLAKDVKEFIVDLKKELKEITFVNQIPEFDEIVGDSIDKLAGKDLI